MNPTRNAVHEESEENEKRLWKNFIWMEVFSASKLQRS